MDNILHIPLSEVLEERTKLDDRIKEAQEQMKILDYIIAKYHQKTKSSSPINMKSKITHRDQIRELVVEILGQNKGQPMHTSEIRQALLKKGVDMKNSTYDAYMSEWSKARMGFERIGIGLYRSL
jgi:hypothetical protein